MPIFKRALSTIDRFFFAEISPEPLAILRISLGLMMLLEAVLIFSSLDQLYGPHGFLQASLMGAVGTKTAPNAAAWFENLGVPYLTLLHAIYSLRVLALVAFTIGFSTRTSTLLVWLTQIFFIYSGEMSSYGVDRYFHLMLFLLIFAPAGAAFSVDQLLASSRRPLQVRVPAWSLRLLQLSILITYVDAGLSKMKGTMWWNGEAIWRVLNMPEFQQFNFSWLAHAPWLATTFAVGTIILETLYIFAVGLPWLGTPWILGIIGMHLGIATFIGLTNFGITMALINVALFLWPRWRGAGLSSALARRSRARRNPIPRST